MMRFVWVLGVVSLALVGCRSAQMQQPGQAEDAVRTNLSQAQGLDASNITVDVIDGVAVLSGTVPTEADRQRAEQIARDTGGITEVRNRIRVAPMAAAPPAAGGPTGAETRPPAAEGPQDAMVRQRVQQRLEAGELEDADVRVQVNDGVVTLTGTVPSREAADRAEAAARNVEGVRRVDNQLTVSPTGGTQTPGNQTGTTGSPQGQ